MSFYLTEKKPPFSNHRKATLGVQDHRDVVLDLGEGDVLVVVAAAAGRARRRADHPVQEVHRFAGNVPAQGEPAAAVALADAGSWI